MFWCNKANKQPSIINIAIQSPKDALIRPRDAHRAMRLATATGMLVFFASGLQLTHRLQNACLRGVKEFGLIAAALC
jgi:hypothetical protein